MAEGESEKKKKLDGEVETVGALYGVPACAMLGSYGGGDAMQMARSLLVRRLAGAGPRHIDEYGALIEAALERQAALPEKDRVAHLPAPGSALPELHWQRTLVLSSHVYGEASVNLFYHGLLFRDVAADPERQGAVRWPLIGVFDAAGVVPLDLDEDPAHVGVDRLKWADVHVHKVGPTWHFGSDMAKFAIDTEQAVVSARCVCVDLESGLAEETALVIVRPDLEDVFERVLRASDDGRDNAKLVKSLTEEIDASLWQPGQLEWLTQAMQHETK